MKSTLTGVGVFVFLMLTLLFGAITNWTFRRGSFVGASYLAAMATLILVLSTCAAVLSTWVARIKGW